MTGTQPDTKPAEGRSRFRVTIEPIMMVNFYIISVAGSPLTDLVMRQCCRQLNLDPANCSSDESTEEEIHQMASNFSMWHVIIDTLPGCIMSLFTGPWSDSNGRKPVIIIALVGTAVSQASLSYMSTIPDMHPYSLLAGGLPMVFTGGFILSIMNAMCYMVDITNTENRVIRFAILMNSSAIGGLIAQFTAPRLEELGFDWLFASNAVLLLICALYVIIFLPESIDVVESKRKTLFTLDHLVDSCQTFFKKRPNHARGILYCLLFASSIMLLIVSGEMEIKYLSTIKKFNWTLQDYSYYSAVSTVLMTLATTSGVYLGLRVLKLSEQMFCVVVVAVMIISELWMTWSRSPAEFYVSSQIKIFNVCLPPVIKSSMSKVVPIQEVSKVIAFQSTIEAFMPQLSAIIYSKFYNAVVGIDAFAVYYLSFILSVAAGIAYVINMILYRRGDWTSINSTSREIEETKEKAESSEEAKKDLEANSSL